MLFEMVVGMFVYLSSGMESKTVDRAAGTH